MDKGDDKDNKDNKDNKEIEVKDKKERKKEKKKEKKEKKASFKKLLAENKDEIVKYCTEKLPSFELSKEEKELSIKIQGSDQEPNGLGIVLQSSNDVYTEFIPNPQDYMKDASMIFSFKLGVVNETSANKLEELYNKYKPMLDEIPFVKSQFSDEKGLKYYFRKDPKNAYIDIVSYKTTTPKSHDIAKVVANLGSFKFWFKIGLSPKDVLELSAEDLAKKIADISFGIEGKIKGADSLCTLVSNAIESLKLEDEGLKEKAKKVNGILKLVQSFGEFKANLKYDKDKLSNDAVKLLNDYFETDLNAKLQSLKMLGLFFGKTSGKSMLESFGIADIVKEIILDDLSLAFLSPEEKRGFVITIKLPGTSYVVNEKILSK